MENPRYSKIWNIPSTHHHDFVVVDYCRFGFDYKKPTKILTNKKLDDVLCRCSGKHKIVLGVNENKGLRQRYQVPEALIEYLFD